jgi:hypothetical protein
MTLEEKLDDAPFPASDPFWLPPTNAESASENQVRPHALLGLVHDFLDR